MGASIRRSRHNQDLSIEQFAQLVGLDTGNLSRIETGKQTPRTKTLARIAEVLNTTPENLYRLACDFDDLSHAELNATENAKNNRPRYFNFDDMMADSSSQVTALGRRVPLISWVQAGYGVTAVDNLHPGEGERIETTYKARRSTYALRVNGDSMEPKFPQGCIVIVEPEDQPEHGKFVIIRQNGDEPTLKQYVVEGSVKYLKPLNPRYPIMIMREDDAFCGVVKRVEMDV